MAIQMRRGNSVDFNPSKMVPGEWAVSQDNEKVYMCFTPGRVIEIGSAASIIPYVEEAEAWAVGTKEGEPVSDTDPQYENNSKYYAEYTQDIVENFEDQIPTATTERPTGADYVVFTVTDRDGTTETEIYDGLKGDKGDTGDTGRGVTSIEMTGLGKNHPIIATYTDGTTETVGTIRDGADGTGSGDMTKATYDQNDDGIVDAAETLQSGNVSLSASVTELNYVHGVTSAIQTQINSKQDELTFDSTPTSGSTNPVTSGGIDTALQLKANTTDLDDWSSSAQVTNDQVTFSGLNDDYGYELYCEDKLIGVSAMTKTGSGTNVTLTFTVTEATNGDVCYLRILK